MDDKPDFDALRAHRDLVINEIAKKYAESEGVDPSEILVHAHRGCYCACSVGGPCEHDWDGERWECPEGSGWSATCSKCGMTAMSHSMRFMP